MGLNLGWTHSHKYEVRRKTKANMWAGKGHKSGTHWPDVSVWGASWGTMRTEALAVATRAMVWDFIKETQTCSVFSSLENTSLQDKIFGHLWCNNSFITEKIALLSCHLRIPWGWTIFFPKGNLHELQEGIKPKEAWWSLCIYSMLCKLLYASFSSVHFSHSAMPDSLRPNGLQHARLPC